MFNIVSFKPIPIYITKKNVHIMDKKNTFYMIFIH